MSLAAATFLFTSEHLVRGVKVETMLSSEFRYGFALFIQPFARLLWGS